MEAITVLRQMHDEACELGEHVMTEKNETPSFFRIRIMGKTHTIMTPWDNDQEKYIYIRAMRVLLRDPMIEAYSFVTEAWMAAVNPRTQKNLMNVAPRDRSDREDVLIILSRHRNGENHATRYKVEYDGAGTVTLSPAEYMEGSRFDEGLIGNLFEEER